MTFKKITFSFIALLLSLLLLLQYWLIQSFTQDVSSKIGQAAFEVSRSTIETLVFRQPNLQIKRFAFQGKLSEQAQLELLNTLTQINSEVNIALRDGQKDNYLTINSGGSTYKVDIPRTGIEDSLDNMSNKILLSAFAFIFIGLIAAGYFAKRLSNPLKDLQIASERVGRGEFGFQIPVNTKLTSVEFTETLNTFNKMSKQIEQLEVENQKLQKQAQLAELSEITRGLAHAIRNPLNTLNLVVDQLATADESTDKKDLNRIAKNQVQRIDKWVRSLMDVMSTDKNLVEELDLGKLIKASVKEISLDNNSKVSIKTKLFESDNPQDHLISAIQPELKSLLVSLITNAVEATEAAVRNNKLATNPVIEINIAKAQSRFEIKIIDQGNGFSPKVMSKLFAPHNTDKTYGAGMGLYLAHRIVTLKYDGDLKIINNDSDRKRQGSTVTVHLHNRV